MSLIRIVGRSLALGNHWLLHIGTYSDYSERGAVRNEKDSELTSAAEIFTPAKGSMLTGAGQRYA
jgi:hypothetical protein